MAIKIAGFEDYLIDELGQVFSCKSNKYIKPFKSRSGYLIIELRNNSTVKKFLVHRLVAEAFIDNPDNLPQVNHKDENKLNNHVDNLEWCTAQYNMTYNGLQTKRMNNTDYANPVFKRVGENVGKLGCKKVVQLTKDNVFIASYDSIKQAVETLKLSSHHITDCCKGKRKTSNGYVWKYESEVI